MALLAAAPLRHESATRGYDDAKVRDYARLLKTEPNPTTITTKMLTHTTGAYQKVIVSSICRDSTTNSQCRSDARQYRDLAWQLYRYTLFRLWRMKSLSCRTPSLAAASDWEFLGLLVLSQRLLITTIL